MNKEIMIATSNAHKVEEFKCMLEPLGYTVKCLLDIKDKIDIIEDGTTFEENALIKARTIYELLHIEVISDDSGICINHFDGKPGVYSARWLGEDTSYEYKNNYVIEELSKASDRGAQYVCSIAHIDIDGNECVYTGICEGSIAYKPLGTNGFGYDPIFYYEDYKTTLANVSDEEKHKISHRAKALELLLKGMK